MSKFKVGDKVQISDGPPDGAERIVIAIGRNGQIVTESSHGIIYSWKESSLELVPKPKRILKQALLLCDVPPKAKTNKYVVTQVLYETLEEAQRDYRNAVRLLDYTAVEVDDE